jgi:hypothetical protein
VTDEQLVIPIFAEVIEDVVPKLKPKKAITAAPLVGPRCGEIAVMTGASYVTIIDATSPPTVAVSARLAPDPGVTVATNCTEEPYGLLVTVVEPILTV